MAWHAPLRVMAQMTGDAAAMRDAVTKVLRTPPEERTEWELQRFLM
jgi:hypothetical protein